MEDIDGIVIHTIGTMTHATVNVGIKVKLIIVILVIRVNFHTFSRSLKNLLLMYSPWTDTHKFTSMTDNYMITDGL